MALYHFTVKSNTKPSGQKISAVDHVKYINREGRFADYDQQDDMFLENLILSNGKKDIFNGVTQLLYLSPFGKIYNTERGLSLTHDPSLETIATALMVANESMKEPLVIKGSRSFQAKCILAAVQTDLPIEFADEQMQSIFLRKKGELENEREEFGRESGFAFQGNTSISESDTKPRCTELSTAPTLSTVPHLRDLPMGYMAFNVEEQSAMLLQEHEFNSMVNGKTDSNDDMRWGFRGKIGGRKRVYRDFQSERSKRARRTARAIIENLDAVKERNRTSAESHVEYINRQKAFEKKGGCVYTKCRLPKWASEWKVDEEGNKIRVPSANVFFRAADRYSPPGDRTYKEVEFALQNELTLEQNLEIVEQFINKHLPNNYYTYAVHDKIGTLSEGTHNLHVHLMFSTREIDEVEKKKERLRSNYFSYPWRVTAKDQSFEKKWNRGAHKDRKWDGHESYLGEFRASYEQITNEVLEKYGWSVRVDHRSLKAQEMEARMNGDTLLAELLHRIPEEHISKKGMLQEKNSAVQRILDYRKSKAEHRNLLFEAELLEEAMNERERKEAHSHIDNDIHRIVESDEFKESDTDADSFMGELRQTFLEAYKDYETMRSQVISADEALEMARMEYMSDEQKEEYQAWKYTLEEIAHWTEFKENLSEPDTSDPDELEAYRKLLPALDDKLHILDERRISLQKKVNIIDAELENESIKKAIQQNTHKILQGQKRQQNLLKQTEKNLRTTILTLSQALFAELDRENQAGIFTCLDVFKDVRKEYYGYKKRVDRLTKQVADAKKQVISPERATKMAENLYVGGAFKKLREEERALKKQVERQEKLEKQLNWQELVLSGAKEDTKLGMSTQEIRDIEGHVAELRKECVALKEQNEQKTSYIIEERRKLTERISTPQAKAKIEDITLGILRKNKPKAQRFEFLSKSLDDAKAKLLVLQGQMTAINKLVKADPKGKRKFMVDRAKANRPTLSHKDEMGILASALSGDRYHMAITKTNKDEEDDKGMKSNWIYMTEAAKEDEQNKAFWNLI